MKYIILAQNIATAKKGLDLLTYHLEVFEISKPKEMIEQREQYSKKLNEYQLLLNDTNITLVQVDKILSFIDTTNSLLVKTLTVH